MTRLSGGNLERLLFGHTHSSSRRCDLDSYCRGDSYFGAAGWLHDLCE